MQRGALSRATASTKMNDLSSRSHAVFLIIVEQMSALDVEGEQIFPSKRCEALQALASRRFGHDEEH